MKRLGITLVIASLSILTTLPTVSQDYPAAAKSLVKQLVGRLKPELKSTLASGGPVNAIQVCPTTAPKITAALSNHNQQIRRVSLKARNASRATPDEWEQGVLLKLEEMAANGVAAAELNIGEVQGSHYRYLQAQVVEPMCLMCHGKNISKPIADALDRFYPDDQATGYELGEIRGGISVLLRISQ